MPHRLRSDKWADSPKIRGVFMKTSVFNRLRLWPLETSEEPIDNCKNFRHILREPRIIRSSNGMADTLGGAGREPDQSVKSVGPAGGSAKLLAVLKKRVVMSPTGFEPVLPP